MHCSEEVARYKIANGMPVFDAAREQKILDKVAGLAGEEYAGAARLLYSSIMAVSREKQHQKMDSGDAIRQLAQTAPRALPRIERVACPGAPACLSTLCLSIRHRRVWFPDRDRQNEANPPILSS